MSSTYQRIFQGPIEAVICDWAGTTYDFGSMAPIMAFQALFEGNGVPISLAEAREPMGTEKREHIRRLLAMPRVAKAWQTEHGAPATEATIDRLYHAFVPMQIKAIEDSAHPIPGWLDTVGWLNDRRIRVGANTGYNHEMLAALATIASQQGYTPESSVCASDVPKGRPYPHMSLKNAIALNVSDVRGCVKVDDTIPGIEEGLSAGMWTVGVAVSGNEVGMNLSQWQSLTAAEQSGLRERAIKRFKHAGSHVVIDSVADLPAAIAQINTWLSQGKCPDSRGVCGQYIAPDPLV